MKILTISFEVNNFNKVKTKKQKGWKVIAAAIDLHRPDIALTAGFAVTSKSGKRKLGKLLEKLKWTGTLITEVRETEMSHQWTRAGNWQRLGKQKIFGSRVSKAQLISFEEELEGRTIEIGNITMGLMICGEIMCVTAHNGSDAISARSQKVEDWLKRCDILLNPTHDKMNNRGNYLDKKRIGLSSQFGEGKVYVSSSNWAAQENQKRDSKDIHTIYSGGEKKEPDFFRCADAEIRVIEINTP